MIRAAACGGSREERERLGAMLDALCLKLADYESAEALLWDVESGKRRYELYILDISSVALEEARRLRMLDDEGVFILLTDSGTVYEEAFGLYALSCLRKPVEEEKLLGVVRRAVRDLRSLDCRVLAVSWRGSTYLLRHQDIEYISSANHALRLHLQNGEERICYARLDKIAEQLPEDRFVRCHQSHMVNLCHVTGHTPRAFHMSGGAVIPISRGCAASARRAFEEYLLHIAPRP